jgi:hypothetical protein
LWYAQSNLARQIGQLTSVPRNGCAIGAVLFLIFLASLWHVAVQ